MSITYALVLACDLLPDGSNIGPKTIMRLECALQHWELTGEHLVVAASFSPRHPYQAKRMSGMMADWLEEHGCTDVIIFQAEMFNTRGETDSFFTLDNARTIISAPWHLRRVKVQLLSDHDSDFVKALQFVPVEKNRMSMKEKFILEPLKLGFELATIKCSRPTRDWMWTKVTKCSVVLGFNLSY